MGTERIDGSQGAVRPVGVGGNTSMVGAAVVGKTTNAHRATPGFPQQSPTAEKSNKVAQKPLQRSGLYNLNLLNF